MPIEHTHSFGRLIIKEAFTAMKKTSLSSYRNHALFALFALLFAACVFCFGCNSGSDSQQTPAPASATPAPTEVPTATPVPEPVRKLTSFDTSLLPVLHPFGQSGALACQSDYESKKTMFTTIDIVSDSVIKSVTIDGNWSVSDEIFPDDTFAAFNADENEWILFDSDLNQKKRFDVETTYGQFSHDLTEYYFLKDSVLCSMNIETGKVSPVEAAFNLRFNSLVDIHPTEDKLFLDAFLSPDTMLCGTALLDLGSNSFSMISSDSFIPHFTEDSDVYFFKYNTDAGGYDVTYSADGSFVFADASLLPGGETELYPVPYSDCIVTSGNSPALFRLGSALECCDLTQYGIEHELLAQCFMPNIGGIIAVSYVESQFEFNLISPSVLDYSVIDGTEPAESMLTVNEYIAEDYWFAVNGSSLPENLQGVRSRADEISEKYGVRILLSSQCLPACTFAEYPTTTTDQMDLADEAASINAALDSLEEALSLYPEGFFPQFRSEFGDGGIRIMLVGGFESNFNMIGYSVQNSLWHNIYVDIFSEGLVGTYCHEIWHATEDHITSINYGEFDVVQWAELNPDGFQYIFDPAESILNEGDYTYFGSTKPKDCYFIDGYAKTNEREDRARIMEYAMTGFFGSELSEYPHLYAKLRYMSDKIRQYFDTTGWSTPRWEDALGE